MVRSGPARGSWVRGGLDQHFARAAPEVRAAFDRVLAAVSALGPVDVLPEKSRIALPARRSFAAFMPRRRWLNGHLVLARQIVSPRFLRVQELSPHNVVHTFRLTSPADVDAQFVTWLAEATGSAPRSTCTADKHRAEAAAADSGVWMTVQRSTQTRETRRTTWQSLC